jgi:LacI family transcriptional regulator, gluconate utilization system Gnt-I transcriptional repressor
VIGVVIPSVTNSVFADLLRGVMDATDDGPWQPQIANTRYVSSRERTSSACSRPSAPRA